MRRLEVPRGALAGAANASATDEQQEQQEQEQQHSCIVHVRLRFVSRPEWLCDGARLVPSRAPHPTPRVGFEQHRAVMYHRPSARLQARSPRDGRVGRDREAGTAQHHLGLGAQRAP